MLDLDLVNLDIRDIPFEGIVVFPKWYTNNFKLTIGSKAPYRHSNTATKFNILVSLGFTKIFEGEVELNKELTIPQEVLVGEFRFTVSSPDIDRGRIRPKDTRINGIAT